MKRIAYYILMILVMAAAATDMQAANKKKKVSDRRKYSQDIHFVNFWGGAGYSGLVNNYAKQNPFSFNTVINDAEMASKFLGGGGGMLGAGYELHHKKFIFTTGPEFRLLTSRDNFAFTNADGEKVPVNVLQPDYSGENMILHYNFKKFHETNVVGQVTLPILFGANFEKYYFLAGGKIGYSIFGHYHQRDKLTTSVTDPMAVEDWYEIPSHAIETDQLGKHPLYLGDTFKGKNKFGLDATVSAEFGVNINEFLGAGWQKENMKKKYPLHMRAAVFMDYGIPNMNKSLIGDGAATFASISGAGMNTTSIHKSYANAHVNSLLVGLKFTALLQLNKPKTPNPRMLLWVTDAFTNGQPTKSIARVSLQQEGRKRPQQKAMQRNGMLAPRMYRGLYDISATAPGYLPSDTMHSYDHQEDMKDTIHFALIPVPKNIIYVHDAKTEEIIPASLKFIAHEADEHFAGGTTAEKNNLEIGLTYGHTYDVVVSAAGYHTDTVSLSDLYDQNVNYYLRPIVRVRHKLILKNMYFATDKTDILPMSEPDILKLYNFLNDNPKIRVLITGHTDSQGSEEHNQTLSEGRSASLKNEMIKRGIAADRMETDGKGELSPIDTNATEEGRQNNRRVEVTVLNEEEAEEDIF